MEASTKICPPLAPCHPSVRAIWFWQSPHLSGEKSSGAPNHTPPQDRLADRPASRAVRATAPLCIYMSAMQVVPEAIISAMPRAAPAATQVSSSLASAGKI